MLRCTAVASLLLLGCRPATSVEPAPVARAEPPATLVLEPAVDSEEPAAASEEPAAASEEPKAPEPSISKDVIRTIVHGHVAEVKRCYDVALGVDPSLTGRVETYFTVGPSGAVIDVDVRATEWPSSEVTRELQRCLGAQIESWTFPPPTSGGNVTITYPFVFVPRADGSV
jgi:hypothetical protein